jgi:hypothetical protein
MNRRPTRCGSPAFRLHHPYALVFPQLIGVFPMRSTRWAVAALLAVFALAALTAQESK